MLDYALMRCIRYKNMFGTNNDVSWMKEDEEEDEEEEEDSLLTSNELFRMTTKLGQTDRRMDGPTDRQTLL